MKKTIFFMLLLEKIHTYLSKKYYNSVMIRLFLLILIIFFIVMIFIKISQIEWSNMNYYKWFGFIFIIYALSSAIFKTF